MKKNILKKLFDKKEGNKRKININVTNEKELVNYEGKIFHIVEVRPEVIFILDEDNNFVTHYCGSINDDEDNMRIINQM